MATDSIITPEFRVSYPAVFTAKKNDLNDKMEYSVVALFPKGADLSKLKAAAQEAAEKKWGKKIPKNLRSPFRDQGERAKEVEDDKGQTQMVLPAGYEEGAIFMTLKSSERPGIIDGKLQPIIDAESFYAGVWAKASVRAYAYDAKGNVGVSFGLRNLQKVRDDDPLTGKRKAEDEFSAIEGAADSDATSLFS
jgi:hypothetical protein